MNHSRRKAIIAALLALFGKLQGQTSAKEEKTKPTENAATFESSNWASTIPHTWSVSFEIQQNKPDDVLLTMHALGREVKLTTKEVMKALEWKEPATVRAEEGK